MQRLLKHTSREHPDHALVTEAIGMVQQVASRINAVKEEALQHEQQQLFLKELENIIEGLVGLVQPDRLVTLNVFSYKCSSTSNPNCAIYFSI